MIFKIQDGSSYNVPIPTYYVESDAEIADIPANAPAGTMVEVNETGNFHVKMKRSDGTWNSLWGEDDE